MNSMTACHCVTIFLMLLIGCSPVENASRPDVPFPTQRQDRPFVFIHYRSGLSRNPTMGLFAAVWPDGSMVRVRTASEIGRAYVRGHLTPEQMSDVRRFLKDSGLFQTRSNDSVIVDAADEDLVVCWGSKTQVWTHNPGYEKFPDWHATNPSITKIKEHLLAIHLADALPEPAKPGEMRRWDWWK
jgi:hypothetical protein